MQLTSKNISPLAQILGFAGLVPFVTLAGLIFLVNPQIKSHLIFSLVAYGATIVSFLGAIHWGLTMREASPNSLQLFWGVVPSLVGWLSLTLAAEFGLCVLAVMLWICLLVDYKIYPQFGLHEWLRMRLILTIVASLSSALPALYIFLHPF
jgi:hypothetical protein